MISDIDKAHPPPLTTEGLSGWLAATRHGLQCIAQTAGSNLGNLEIAVMEHLCALGVSLLTEAAHLQAQATAFLCTRCQGPLLREAKGQGRNIDSAVGQLRLGRDYGWCARCQDWCYPADTRWGLHPNVPASPRVQEMAAEAVLKMPCAEAEKSLPRLGGARLSSTTLHREAARQGGRALTLQQADQHRTATSAGVVQLAKQAKTPVKPFVLIIEMDAWNIRERTNWGRTKALRKK